MIRPNGKQGRFSFDHSYIEEKWEHGVREYLQGKLKPSIFEKNPTVSEAL